MWALHSVRMYLDDRVVISTYRSPMSKLTKVNTYLWVSVESPNIARHYSSFIFRPNAHSSLLRKIVALLRNIWLVPRWVSEKGKSFSPMTPTHPPINVMNVVHWLRSHNSAQVAATAFGMSFARPQSAGRRRHMARPGALRPFPWQPTVHGRHVAATGGFPGRRLRREAARCKGSVPTGAQWAVIAMRQTGMEAVVVVRGPVWRSRDIVAVAAAVAVAIIRHGVTLCGHHGLHLDWKSRPLPKSDDRAMYCDFIARRPGGAPTAARR